ncbi:spindle assembly checkpoint kinase [Apophysomyces ossiformis]|uniref:Aurora kinase n=1 Tax=Apophysomyces ossiformis TaxID=679940 RepID=A0A8H7BMG0_9FUNG|nr:spindle assembly checkpoint kinase [Apophysomyces ossiformis]
MTDDNDGYQTPCNVVSTPTVPLSAYVDYTPRRTFTADRPDLFLQTHPSNVPLSRQSRAYYFHQLAQQAANEAETDVLESSSYMDSPIVRRYLGVSSNVVPIKPQLVSSRTSPAAIEPKERQEWRIDDFDVGRHLGTGKFGTVYLAQEKASQQIVALKILEKKEIIKAKVAPFIKREIEIQSHLRHPNTLSLFGYFHDDRHIYMVLEYAGQGELYSILRERGRLSERTAVIYITQIVRALTYIHRLGIIHRDLKPENVLIGDDGQLKLSDFGWSVYDPTPRRRTFCGTLDYLPPEMIENKTHDKTVDLWALGVMSYEMLVGAPPFEDLNGYAETYTRIRDVEYDFPAYLSAEAKDFVSKLLRHNPQERLRLHDIAAHPWMTKFQAK